MSDRPELKPGAKVVDQYGDMAGYLREVQKLLRSTDA